VPAVRRSRPRPALASIVLLACAVGCARSHRAAWTIGWTFHEYQGQILRVAPGSPGARCLELQTEVDPGLRHFVQQNGSPDYIRLVDIHTVELAYIGDDRLLRFVREKRTTFSSRVVVIQGIPLEFAALMTREDRERLARVRAPGGAEEPAAVLPAVHP